MLILSILLILLLVRFVLSLRKELFISISILLYFLFFDSFLSIFTLLDIILSSSKKFNLSIISSFFVLLALFLSLFIFSSLFIFELNCSVTLFSFLGESKLGISFISSSSISWFLFSMYIFLFFILSFKLSSVSFIDTIFSKGFFSFSLLFKCLENNIE